MSTGAIKVEPGDTVIYRSSIIHRTVDGILCIFCVECGKLKNALAENREQQQMVNVVLKSCTCKRDERAKHIANIGGFDLGKFPSMAAMEHTKDNEPV